MTNEELAVAIKAGSTDCICSLWENIQRFAYQQSNRYYTTHYDLCISVGITIDDLNQEAFFALLEAIEAYNPDTEYSFLTYMRYPLQNAFNALCGMRTAKQRADALNISCSIYDPIGEDELTIADTIADDTATEEMEAVVNDTYIKQLHSDLETCLAILPHSQRSVIKAHYYDGLSFDTIGKAIGLTATQCRNREAEGLRKLRYGNNSARLKPYQKEIASGNAYKGGIEFWKTTGGSSVEWEVLKREYYSNKAV